MKFECGQAVLVATERGLQDAVVAAKVSDGVYAVNWSHDRFNTLGYVAECDMVTEPSDCQS